MINLVLLATFEMYFDFNILMKQLSKIISLVIAQNLLNITDRRFICK